MNRPNDVSRSIRWFQLLTIVGCAGTLVFLGLEAYSEHFSGEWKRWQARYVEQLPQDMQGSFEPGIKQAFLPDLGRVDRCQSCHLGIDDPGMAQAQPPLRTHPGGLLGKHPPETFGCTICHQGQGRAVTQADAHGAVPHWEEPLLVGELVYTSCGRCHAEGALYGQGAPVLAAGSSAGEIHRGELRREVPGAGLLARGKQLVARSGCLGCHVYRGRGGTLGAELTFVGDKGVHGYDFSHLAPGVERTPLEWLKAHFMDPGAVSPGTVMPGVESGAQGAEALAAYMLSLRSSDLPARFRPGLTGERGEPASGEELYELFCVACHGRDLQGSDVPAIRTPSLSNEDFLSVADADYLRYVIEHGRSGSEMPGWGLGKGGLTPAQIERVVDYILSFGADRADPAEISTRDGDPHRGRSYYRGSCAACHGLNGEGGIGTSLNSPDFLGLASDEFLIHTLLEGRPGTGMPSWRTLSSQAISDLLAYVRQWGEKGAQAAEVFDYLASGAADPVMGERLYQGRCVDCHGRAGRGAIGPSLDHEAFLSIVPDEYLVHALLEGRPDTAMPAWRELAAADVGDLVSYLRSLADVEYAPAPALVAQGDPETGELLFARNCSSCHGADAVGGVGPQLRNPVFLRHASDGFLFATIAGGRYGTAMRGFLKPRVTSDGRRIGDTGITELSESQLADLVAWLRSLEHAGPADRPRFPVLGSASRGREIYEDTGSCAKCHGYQGEGGVGPALGNRSFLRHASEGYLLGTMVRGRSGTEMRSYVASGMVHLRADELMDVAAYVRTLAFELPEGRAGWRVYQATADQEHVGEELFGLYCAACHGVEGVGGYAPELNNPEFLAAASDGFLVATIARGRIGTPMRPFGFGPASLADLTHAEIRDLVGYMRSWQAGGSEPAAAPPPVTITALASDGSSPE